MIKNKDGNLSSETPLLIESITLPDGKTPDERVQYKIGREVFKLIGAGLGCPFFIFYDEKRGWRTNPISSIEEDNDKIVLQDNLSIYTFKKLQELKEGETIEQ